MAHTSPTKLLLISPLPPPPGGIATWTQILLSTIGERKDIHVSHVNTALRWRQIVSQSIFMRVTCGSIQGICDGLQVFTRLIVERPDVMHVTTSGRMGLARDVILMLMARLFRVRSLLHIHDPRVGQIQPNQKWQIWLTFLALRFPDRVVVLDQKSLEVIEKRLPKACVIKIPNMVSLEEIDSLVSAEPRSRINEVDKTFRIVFVGRVTPQKGIEDLVKACIDLVNVHIHCLGPIDDNCQVRVKNFAQARDEGQWLKFFGYISREEVVRQLSSADLFVLPSHSEAFPLSILESMALFIPVVATNVGAIREMLHPDETKPCGICVEVGDIQELKAAISSLQNNPDLRDKIGSHGRNCVEELYSTTQVFNQLLHQWKG